MWKFIKLERIDKPEPLAIMTTSQLDWIYDDRGTGGPNSAAAIYRPKNTDGYYSLGDVGLRKSKYTTWWRKSWR